MTVPTGNDREDYEGNGNTDTYAYSWRIFNKNQLKVIQRVNSTGAETELTVDTDYTVSGIKSTSGGNITLTAGNLASGIHLTILPNFALEQATDFRNQGSFFAETHEDQFDKLTMIAKQLNNDRTRSLKIPESFTPAEFSTDLPSSLVGKAGVTLMTNEDGTGLVPGPTADEVSENIADSGTGSQAFGVALDRRVISMDTEAAMKAEANLEVTTPPTYVQTAGKASKGDGEGHLFEIVASGGDVTLDNGNQAKISDKVKSAGGVKTVGAALDDRVIGTDSYSSLPAIGSVDLAASVADDGLYFGDQATGEWSKIQDTVASASAFEGLVKSQSASNGTVTFKKVGDSYIVCRHLGKNNWLEVTLTNSGQVATGVDSPWKVTSQIVKTSSLFILSTDSTATGTWTEFNSNDSDTYIGHESLRSNSVGDDLSFTFSGGGDLYFHYVADTDGGIADVVVDGGDAVSVDMYSATANDFNQETLIESGLSDASHTVTVTISASANPSSTGNQVWVDALSLVTDSLSPTDPRKQPPAWEESTSYSQYDEVVNSVGRYYVAQTTGTSGSTEPTHTSGTVSDGGVDWLAVANSSFEGKEFRIQALGSEMEYAYEIIPSGQSVKNDVGGNSHGNEYLSSPVTVIVDAQPYLSDDHISGNSIEIIQEITQFYGAYVDSDIIGTVIQVHKFTGDCMTVSYKLTWQQNADVGWFYTAMWPVLTYDAGGNYRKQFLTMETPQAKIALADYENDGTNPIVGNKKDYAMVMQGRAYVPEGSSGVPVSSNGDSGVTLSLIADYQSLNAYKDSGINAGMAPNINGGEYTGFSSWVSKMYFQRMEDSQQTAVLSGETITARNRYYVTMGENMERF